MKPEITNLAVDLGKSLFNNIIDPAMDVMEIPIDALFEDGSLLEAIPILKTIHAVGKTYVAIRDKYLFRRLVVFIQEINSGDVSQEEKDKYIDRLDKNKTLNSELERLLLFIDQCSYEEQSRYLGRFFKVYIKEEISWEVLQELAEANQRMFICDYDVLQYIYSLKSAAHIKHDQESSINRLVSLGLINDLRIKNDGIMLVEQAKAEGLSLTEFGNVFCRYMDKKEYDFATEIKEILGGSSKYISPREKRMSSKERDQMLIQKIVKQSNKQDKKNQSE